MVFLHLSTARNPTPLFVPNPSAVNGKSRGKKSAVKKRSTCTIFFPGYDPKLHQDRHVRFDIVFCKCQPMHL